MTDLQVKKQHRVAQYRINKGVRWLDKTIPDWLEKLYPHVRINVEVNPLAEGRFNMNYASECVLGWAYGDYWKALTDLVPPATPTDPSDYAKHRTFGRKHGFSDMDCELMPVLQDHWITTVQKLAEERGIAK